MDFPLEERPTLWSGTTPAQAPTGVFVDLVRLIRCWTSLPSTLATWAQSKAARNLALSHLGCSERQIAAVAVLACRGIGPNWQGSCAEDRRPRSGSPHKRSGHLTVAAGPARPAKPSTAPLTPLRLRARGRRIPRTAAVHHPATAEKKHVIHLGRRSKADSCS